MPDKADLPAVLRVLDVPLRKLPDDVRLPLAPRLVRQCVAGKCDAVSSPAEDPDGAQNSATEACASRFAEINIVFNVHRALV